MIILRRTDSDDLDFKALVKLLDAELAERDGADHGFYAQFNKIDKIRHAVVCYENDRPIGCGAIKAFNDEAMEVKRMYVSPDGRNKGIATRVLTELENWANELGYAQCVLETGKRQPEAIALYEKNGYQRTENYGQYVGVENSVCFAKSLRN
ncbi:GNAT superfamily N-acetyltransferase [Dyadobacter sp. BE34]|uniref:GNAT superfamily N-acetyltransferase n=1 Tax=Dyadobacter fermentans TaxID=94254 RepID=A0ABU1QXH0_9BACT|nr:MULTISPECIES: GNAT family N-acetyltransferase [Dyadobacter]MDR6805858.1 GNAT superfamily N-acetyltransferase [Dyadobacter fermentans]MDR7042381.1 GNAT superfamily N-acetyltransferase [Dyadobacter sp. BE242]MDR7201379.1 GNAT superfamily N-acetyltransferase [Dyadobacter sp. BE34]MDR7215872.1 GNAT superfamily N-acetyltransferase [Dyadobacter sp. BE31]MDR7263408.1 GNAT superfamily N-acetyltransferase [Dyadobacter sp. BE32]